MAQKQKDDLQQDEGGAQPMPQQAAQPPPTTAADNPTYTPDQLAASKNSSEKNSLQDLLGIHRDASMEEGTAGPNNGKTPAGTNDDLSPYIDSSHQSTAGSFMGLNSDTYNLYGLDQRAFTDPNADADKHMIGGAIAELQSRNKPQQMQAANIGSTAQNTAATIDGSQQNDWRGQQMGLAGQLTQQAAGRGPSLAGTQYQNAANQGMANQLAMAASSRGVNPAMAMRQAQMGQASINQDAAAGAAQTAIQEQMGARQQLSGLLDQGRGQDIGLATNQAGLNQQSGLANQAALNSTASQNAQFQQAAAGQNLTSAVDQQKFIDEQVAKYRAMGLGLDQATFAARQAYATQAQNAAASQYATMKGQSTTSSAQAGQAAGAGLAAAGTIIAAAV